ncbi:MAG: hypothetical protein HY532_00370 [Chloroflexi bacterium]|nr:hypothetical protein [Chloroflexota bacterium]
MTPTGTLATGQTSTPGVAQGRVVAYASVNVEERTQGRLTRLTIVPNHPVVSAGDTVVFSVLAYDEAGQPIAAGELDVEWRATDPQVGTMTASGILRAGVQRGVFDRAVQVTVSQMVEGRRVSVQALASVSIIGALSENDIARLEVLPSVVQLEPNGQTSFTPLAVDRSGVPVPGVDYTWEMLEPAAGSIAPGGRFTAGPQEGSFPAAIRVVAQKRSDLSQTATALIPVTILSLGAVQAPTKVNLFPQSISVRPGDVVEFRAIALDSRGNLVSNVQTQWRLAEPRAGSLDSRGQYSAGQISGTFPGVIEVTVQPLDFEGAPPLRATATITVLSPLDGKERLQSLVLAPQVLRLRPGESLRMTATALTNLGQVAAGATMTWSGDQSVVAVQPDGLVTALDRPGTYPDAVSALVTLSENGQVVTRQASGTVIILGPLARVEVVPQEVSVAPRQVVQFTFIAYDTQGIRLFDVLPQWEILDPAAGTIDDGGFFVAGAQPGQYEDVVRVTVRVIGGSGGGG